MSLNCEVLKGKHCVVTGSVRSMGYAIAESYCASGASVSMIDLNPGILDAAAGLRAKGYEATGYVLDITDRDRVMETFAAMIDKYGPVYSLVNAAGVGEIGPFEDEMPSVWEKVWRVNVMGTVYCIQAAIPSMREQRQGKIMNLASKAGKVGSKLMTVYGASKGAVITLTQALAQEYAKFGLNINCLCPDIVDDTGIWEEVVQVNYARDYGITPEEVRKMYENKVPLGRFVSLEDITDMVMFYTISGHDCTGQSINLTGGRVM